MFGTQRKPAFVLLLRSLVSCEGQPITANQLSVTRVLMTTCKAALPKVLFLCDVQLSPYVFGTARTGSTLPQCAVCSISCEIIRLLVSTGKYSDVGWWTRCGLWEAVCLQGR